MKEFTVTKNHIKLLQNLNIGWIDFEWGSPGVDPKRPFGNGDLYEDMSKLLGITIPEDTAVNYEIFEQVTDNLYQTYQELQICLQILCRNISIEEGTYICDDYQSNWRKRD